MFELKLSAPIPMAFRNLRALIEDDPTVVLVLVSFPNPCYCVDACKGRGYVCYGTTKPLDTLCSEVPLKASII